MMELFRAYRVRVRMRPDSEPGQALLRAVIVLLLACQTAWVAAREPERAVRLWTINVTSIAFSLLLFARILHRPAASPRRRIVGAFHDNVAATIWLYSCGPMGALALFAFPFVTVGNGFRYGVRYLALSGFLGALGIGTLVAAAPGWRAFGMIGAGVLLSHVVVTVYTGALLGRLRRTQDQLERMATSDALTGLPNRRHFMDRLSHMVLAHDRPPMACLYLDLDGFKGVNDRCGHEVGDRLLGRVAEEVVRCIRPADMLARLGGDEFTVVLDGPQSADHAKAVADRIIRAVEAIADVDGHPVDVAVSIGISFIPAGQQVPSEELLKAADEAMYVAKRSGKGRYRCMDFAAGAFVHAA
jgi:diguanylate cyclase (GGDEF)-like protein